MKHKGRATNLALLAALELPGLACFSCLVCYAGAACH